MANSKGDKARLEEGSMLAGYESVNTLASCISTHASWLLISFHCCGPESES